MGVTTRDSLVVTGIALVIVLIMTLAVYVPQGRKLEELRGRIASHETALASNAKKVALLPEILRQVEMMKSRYKDFHRKLPKRQELGPFLTEIGANLEDTNLSNHLIEPGSPTRRELYHTLPITMRFRGSYLAMAEFLKRINSMERLTRVQKLSIAADAGKEADKDKALDIELQMNIYFTES